MLLNEDELKQRLESPMNLLNRLKTSVGSAGNTSIIPSLPPTSDEIIEDLNDKITVGSIKTKAMGLMSAALDELKVKIGDVSPAKLAAVAADMSKVINNVEPKKDIGGIPMAQIIIYAPQIVLEETFNTVNLDA